MVRIGVIVFLICVPFLSFGQVRKLIRKGNKEYKHAKYSQAEIIYRQAQASDTTSGDINYNIGNSLFKQQKYEQALSEYQNSLSKEKSPVKQALNFHNEGNAFFKLQKYQESVNAYKKALKINPSDNETRYNLAVAQNKLKEQQKNNNQNKNNDQKDKQNKNQNQNKDQNKDKNKDKQNNKDQNKDQNDKNQDKDKQQQQEPKISKEDAERMLDALQTGENETQQRVKARKVKVQVRQTDKNW